MYNSFQKHRTNYSQDSPHPGVLEIGVTLKNPRQLLLVFLCIGVAWLVFISGMMIVDVWDESQLLQQLPQDPSINPYLVDTIVSIWLFDSTQVTWRPLAQSVFFTLATLTNGDFVLLRYFNAVLVLSSVYLLTRSLMLGYRVSAKRALAFFVIVLFSASSLITAGWFANIFDALCLFFIALAVRLYVSEKNLACGIFFSLAVFCKETHVLAFPLLLWMVLRAPPPPSSIEHYADPVAAGGVGRLLGVSSIVRADRFRE